MKSVFWKFIIFFLLSSSSLPKYHKILFQFQSFSVQNLRQFRLLFPSLLVASLPTCSLAKEIFHLSVPVFCWTAWIFTWICYNLPLNTIFHFSHGTFYILFVVYSGQAYCLLHVQDHTFFCLSRIYTGILGFQ